MNVLAWNYIIQYSDLQKVYIKRKAYWDEEEEGMGEIEKMSSEL